MKAWDLMVLLDFKLPVEYNSLAEATMNREITDSMPIFIYGSRLSVKARMVHVLASDLEMDTVPCIVIFWTILITPFRRTWKKTGAKLKALTKADKELRWSMRVSLKPYR